VASLIIDGARMAEILRSPTGIVAQHLIARATIVQAAAKHQAPRRTGCLAETIVKRAVEEDPVGLSIRIVSDTTPCSPSRTSYSYYVHEGTEPHQITAKPGGVLAFMWNGQMVFVKSVQHPGQAANRFLSDNLPLALA
jgi:hypothetical protein